MKPKLTNKDFCREAKRLNCEVAAIKAVAQVESAGDGFDDNDRPKILFERHKFYKYCDRKHRAEWSQKYPGICNPNAGGYGKSREQYSRFNQAFALDPEAAMMACSWGKFQVMGFNYDDLGYKSIHEFVDLMKSGEAAHLDSFVRFVIKNGLKDELQRKDWKGFARLYNGSGYRKNNYDTKMASFYSKFRKENINCKGNLEEPLPEEEEQPVEPSVPESEDERPLPEPEEENKENSTETKVEVSDKGEVKVETSSDGDKNSAVQPKVAIEKPESQGFGASIWKKITGLFGANVGIQALSDQAQQFQLLGLSQKFWTYVIFTAFVGSLIWLLMEYLKYRNEQKRNLEITNTLVAANSTTENKVVLVDKDKIEEFRNNGYKIVYR